MRKKDVNAVSRRFQSPAMSIAVAMYLPEQYPRLVATAEDAQDLEATWQEWHRTAKETIRKMAMLGMHLIEVPVDLDDLEIYCLQQLRKAIQTTSNEFNRVIVRYETHVLPLIRALGMHDSTPLIKEKTFELKPLQVPLDVQGEGEKNAPIQEEDTMTNTGEEVQDDISWQGKITGSLKKLKVLFLGDGLNQENEEDV